MIELLLSALLSLFTLPQTDAAKANPANDGMGSRVAKVEICPALRPCGPGTGTKKFDFLVG
jgi:hypothetical protein